MLLAGSELRFNLISFDLTAGFSYPFRLMKRLLTSCFGLGRLPIAPGTWGSLPVVVIFGSMCHFHLSGPSITLVMAVLVIAGSVICVKFAPAAIAATGKNDPGEVVADELAGQALTYLVIPFFIPVILTPVQNCVITSGGFLLFRLFDIAKPWPIRKLEMLPKGWGILADDLLAGVFAAIALLIVIFSWMGG
jgi:phosphatidylglycerophosphatase A